MLFVLCHLLNKIVKITSNDKVETVVSPKDSSISSWAFWKQKANEKKKE
jgi:hypothetical protein